MMRILSVLIHLFFSVMASGLMVPLQAVDFLPPVPSSEQVADSTASPTNSTASPDNSTADSVKISVSSGTEAKTAQVVDEKSSDTVAQSSKGKVAEGASEQDQAREAEAEQGQVKRGATEEGPASELETVRELFSFTKLISILIILTLTYFLNRFLILVLDSVAERFVRHRLFLKRLAPILRILIWSTTLYIVIAGVISPPFETILAISASVGIAVGFASQDILRNIFGGIIVILDKPFQVGDKIQVGEHYGEVLSIGLRSSRIVTPDDSVVTIPNSELMNQAVSNTNSGQLDCQVVSEILLPASVDIQKVKEIARKAVFASPYAYLKKPVAVIVTQDVRERHFLYKVRVKAYVLDIRYEFPFQSSLTEVIVTECDRRGWIPNFSHYEHTGR